MNASPAFFQSANAVVSVVRELEEADVLLLGVVDQGSLTPPVKRLNDRHHKVAQLLASGLPPVEVSAITGMCQSRISILKNDPAFKDLLAFYTDSKRSAAVDQLARLGLLTAVAIEELASRIEDKPEEFTPKDLVSVAKLAADRSGFGPTSKQQILHAHVGPREIAALKEGIGSGNVRFLTPQDRGAEKRLADIGRPVLEAGEANSGAEEGTGVREEGSEVLEARSAGGNESGAVDTVR